MDFILAARLPAFSGTILSLALFIIASFPLHANALSEDQLEKDYQQLAKRFYVALSKSDSECLKQQPSFAKLIQKVKELEKLNQHTAAMCVLQKHENLLKKNIDNRNIFYVFNYLLKNNFLSLANALHSHAKDEGDKSLLSNIAFIYSRYYARNNDWDKVLTLTKGIYSDLSFEDANLARLHHGIALQKNRKHRLAAKIYLAIPQNSQYYSTARLNIATAYIRQDWWTDAHIKINEIINSKNSKADAEDINRLYLVLGYSYLRKEYYRDAREAFRNIEVNSQYFNKALLGIALTATNQQDFIGALNAINILRKKEHIDLSIDESHLLLPYLYEKLQQNMTASASYTDALKYYQSRATEISKLKNIIPASFYSNVILKTHKQFIVENTVFDTANQLSYAFIENMHRISAFHAQAVTMNNTHIVTDIKNISQKYQQLLLNKVNSIYDTRLDYLDRYLNQARFGMARLFDNSSSATN